MTTIKQQLLIAGMKKNQLDNHSSDLYVLKNEVSEKWLQSYEYKNQVTTFKSETDNEVYYEIPFAYMNEYVNNKKKF